MSVEFIPNNKDCFEFGLPNGTWFKILENKNVKELIGGIKSNDPLKVSSSRVFKMLWWFHYKINKIGEKDEPTF